MAPPVDPAPSIDGQRLREDNVIDGAVVVPSPSQLAAGGVPTRLDQMSPRNAFVEPRLSDDDVERRLRQLSRRGFAWAGAAAVAGIGGWRWLVTRADEGGLPWPLRRVLEFDERVARGLFRPSRLSPQFARSAARTPRVNGVIGLDSDLDPAEWRLRVSGSAGEQAARSFTLDQIKALPRTEMTTELRCIEGWSEVVHWAGAQLAEVAAIMGLANNRKGRSPGYVALRTPDGSYYVGLDIASALHPQTLLCYEMNGRPLTPEHGAPLRLVIPIKYGIKNLKRIGSIQFSDARPADYWAERGYDWYSGH